jgi:hypothetical protein
MSGCSTNILEQKDRFRNVFQDPGVEALFPLLQAYKSLRMVFETEGTDDVHRETEALSGHTLSTKFHRSQTLETVPSKED